MNSEHSVRRLEAHDIPAVEAIARASLIQPAHDISSGYLTRSPTPDEFARYGDTSICLVSCKDKIVNGYLTAFYGESLDPEMQDIRSKFNAIEWNSSSPETKNLIYIDQIAVSAKHQRSGVATLLIQSLFEQFSDFSLLAAIVEKPIKNEASIAFFSKLKFSKIGERRVEQYRGFKQFQSGWYYRPGVNS